MTTEVWWRNPEKWIRHVVSEGGSRVVWHRGRLIKRRINPVAHASLFFPGLPWRVLSVGVQGALEWTPQSRSERDPVACYPCWHYGEPWDRLEALVSKDAAEVWDGDDEFYAPRPGQERRVLIVGYPGLNELVGRRLLSDLGDLQDEHPDAIMHIFETRNFRVAFSYGFRAADLEVYTDARFKRIFLPSGKRVQIDELQPIQRQWVNMLGFSAPELTDEDNRIAFSVRSAHWAGEHYLSDKKFRTTGGTLPLALDDEPLLSKAPTTSQHRVATVGDKVACDHCSLFDGCKLARVGGVCTLPGTEASHLARFFKTRDSDRIMEGLSELLAQQAVRAEQAMEWEQINGELDPELTKILAVMFEGGVKLAKLTNPALAAAAGPKIAVQINQGGVAQQITAANPASLMASLVRELEARGVPREEITPEMVMRMVGGDQSDIIDVEARELEA